MVTGHVEPASVTNSRRCCLATTYFRKICELLPVHDISIFCCLVPPMRLFHDRRCFSAVGNNTDNYTSLEMRSQQCAQTGGSS